MDRAERAVTLERPIQVDGNDCSEVTIREPGPKDMELADEGTGDVAKANRLLASCAGIPLSSVHQMKMADWARCHEALAELQGAGLGFTKPERSRESSSA